MTRIAVLTAGLWALRREIEALSGMAPVRWDPLSRPAFDAVAGWGYAPTTRRARRLAEAKGKPYFAFEDGPLRSVRPGPSEPPMSLIMDRGGMYYDAAGASDLIALAAHSDWFTPEINARAAAARDQLRRLRLSKYNSGRDLSPSDLGLRSGKPRVLVLDQVRNDASIRGALADASSFAAMLESAQGDNPGAEIIVKLHPDVMSGRRAGHFSELKPGQGLTLVAEPVNPWSLLDIVDSVYTVSSGMGFEAALAGRNVVTFGSPFYAGWGFTDDRRLQVRRPAERSALELFAAYHLRYARYFDAYSRREIAFEDAADQLAWRRDRFHDQARRSVCYRISRWKRPAFKRMLDGPHGAPLFSRGVPEAVALAKREGGQIVSWASRDNSGLQRACETAGVALVRVEDGFIRSAGLGASFVPPLSLAFDGRGIYYDSTRSSDLEALIQAGPFPEPLVARARRLREALVAHGTTKYNIASAPQITLESGGRPIILVPGQVEDDASIRRGAPSVRRNVDLLAAARERHPDAYILYKPHPDVEAGFRRGRIRTADLQTFSDGVARNASILQLIALADRVETITSLAGFEALLRGKAVTTHGQPFYSGWGLTEDLCPVPSRTRKATLDEVVAAALILYPRYVDPVSGLVCAPELLVRRLSAAARPARGDRAIRLGKTWLARGLYLGRSLRTALKRGAERQP